MHTLRSYLLIVLAICLITYFSIQEAVSHSSSALLDLSEKVRCPIAEASVRFAESRLARPSFPADPYTLSDFRLMQPGLGLFYESNHTTGLPRSIICPTVSWRNLCAPFYKAFSVIFMIRRALFNRIGQFRPRNGFCKNRNEFNNTQEHRLVLPYNSATLFIARNPVVRLLSGFIDKCINEKAFCFNCTATDILCIIEGFHKEIMQLNRKHWDITIPKTSYIPQQYATQHFSPSSWQCDLYEESDKYIFVKYGENPEDLKKMYQKLEEIFRAHGVEEEKISYIMGSITKRTKHATSTNSAGNKEKYMKILKNSPKHRTMLNEIYFYDNQIFGYDPL